MNPVRSETLLAKIRNDEPVSRTDGIELVARLSLPAILSQLSIVLMQVIDAAMVGHLRPADAAAIGAVVTTTWLWWGIAFVPVYGFPVLVSHAVGARNLSLARQLVRCDLVCATLVGVVMSVLGCAIASQLPRLMGVEVDVVEPATRYFGIYMAGFALMFLNTVSGSLIRASGNMRYPSAVCVAVCLLDVLFNALLIFPSTRLEFAGCAIVLPGADLGVSGAALGTVLADGIGMILMLVHLVACSQKLRIWGQAFEMGNAIGHFLRQIRIGVPAAGEKIVMGLGYVTMTYIIAPLGTVAIAAHSFALTVESLCYTPGYGIGEAARNLIGQCVGAGRYRTARRLAWLLAGCAMAVMGLGGALLFACSEFWMALLTSSAEIARLGAQVLRIEAFAEPFYAAQIAITGVLVGAGRTLFASSVNMSTMWVLRIPLMLALIPVWGLPGAWFAMAFELVVRGSIFLVRLKTMRTLRIGDGVNAHRR